MKTEIITLTRNDEYEFLSSKSSGIKAIKIKSLKGKFSEKEIEQRAKTITNDLGYNFVKSNGVYFLELEDKFYIGKTNDFTYRLPQHTEVRNIKSITFFMNNDTVNGWDESETLDIESVLIDYAIEFGFSLNETLDNKKTEKRTKKKAIDRLGSKEDANDIWEKILFLNTEAIISLIKKTSGKKISTKLEVDPMTLDFSNVISTTSKYEKINSQKDFIIKKNEFNIFVDTTKETRIRSLHIFGFVDYKENTSKSYNGKKVGVFKKDLAVRALKQFLIDGIPYNKVEIDLTNGLSTDSWLISSTLAYLRISNDSRGALKNVDKETSVKMIYDIVEQRYEGKI